jgi:hypothetical protein
MTPARPQEYRRTLIVVRYVLPSALLLAGLILILAEPRGATLHGGLGIIGAGLAAFLFAFLAKVSMSGDTHQQKDEQARAYFDEHGRWPDDD